MRDDQHPHSADGAPVDVSVSYPPLAPSVPGPGLPGLKSHPLRRSTDVAPAVNQGERRTDQRRRQVSPLRTIAAGHNPFVAANNPTGTHGAGTAHNYQLDDIGAEVSRRRDKQLHLHLVTGEHGAGKTTVAHDLTGHWRLGGGLLTPRMFAARVLARPPSFVAAVRLAWWVKERAASARADTAIRQEDRWRASLLAPRARLLMGMHCWPYPPPDRGWALAVVIDDAHGIGCRSLGTLCRGLNRVARQDAPVHLVLVGSPALPERIPLERTQHVRAHWTIAPHDASGLEEIVTARLEKFDGARDALDRDAYETLHRLSAGLPGAALDLCARTLERARAEGSAHITPRHLVEQESCP